MIRRRVENREGSLRYHKDRNTKTNSMGKEKTPQLSNARVWLLDHLTPSLPVPTDNVVSWKFIQSSALAQVIAIHSGMTAERAGQAKGVIPRPS
ncbi:hypothetical protein TNCV_1220731 [Trichonephila clavipes]|nr:hypothetical protein TNCV_1220731 [Trichonephila clavipes]